MQYRCCSATSFFNDGIVTSSNPADCRPLSARSCEARTFQNGRPEAASDDEAAGMGARFLQQNGA